MDTLALLVGFSSYSTFYKTFLKVTHKSPLEFKNSLD
jgi:AraC-like DNA-binding protein